jgi:SPP1 gp7 family putative phage head morphogenesis protein
LQRPSKKKRSDRLQRHVEIARRLEAAADAIAPKARDGVLAGLKAWLAAADPAELVVPDSIPISLGAPAQEALACSKRFAVLVTLEAYEQFLAPRAFAEDDDDRGEDPPSPEEEPEQADREESEGDAFFSLRELQRIGRATGELAAALQVGDPDGVLAIDRLVSEETARRLRVALQEAYDRGETAQSFLAAMRELTEAGELPTGMDSYLQMVFRTEMAKGYEEQREAFQSLPEVRDHTWGYELLNPDDDRSRPTHAAIDGLILKKDSLADRASRPGPPWHYQCRCTRVPIVVADVSEADQDYAEPPDALARVRAIERW